METTSRETINTYIENKLDMLTEEFCFRLTSAEKRHMRELKTEISVDQYARVLFKKYLRGY